MSEQSVGTSLRNLKQAQDVMRKARKSLRLVRESAADPQKVLAMGWESLGRAHRVLAEVPLESANDEVMSRQIAVQRYATALLVRLRRLARNDFGGLDDPDEDDGGE